MIRYRLSRPYTPDICRACGASYYWWFGPDKQRVPVDVEKDVCGVPPDFGEPGSGIDHRLVCSDFTTALRSPAPVKRIPITESVASRHPTQENAA